MSSLRVSGGTVVTPQGQRRADIRGVDGRVVTVGTPGSVDRTDEEIDATRRGAKVRPIQVKSCGTGR